MKSQKQAVVNTLLSVLKERGVDYEMKGETPIKEVLTKDDRDKARVIIIAGFQANEISLSESAQAKYLSDESAMNTYVNGLIKNWISKNPDFNSGNKYTPKNPGSRAGQGDETVRALRALLKVTSDEEVRDEVNQALKARLEEIKPTQAVEINVDALPDHLRHLVK